MKIKLGETYHVDTPFDAEDDGRDIRLVDDVKVVGAMNGRVLVYSPKLRANIILPKKELKPIKF